jgi:hypothetical protein
VQRGITHLAQELALHVLLPVDGVVYQGLLPIGPAHEPRRRPAGSHDLVVRADHDEAGSYKIRLDLPPPAVREGPVLRVLRIQLILSRYLHAWE